LFANIIAVCKPFLGDQTESFLSRQCIFHLHIPSKDLTKNELPELARWAEISGALVIGKDKAKEMRRQIEALYKRKIA
jgi:hypothetical protein